MNEPYSTMPTPMPSEMAAREQLRSGALWREASWVSSERVLASTRLSTPVLVWTYACYAIALYTLLWAWYHFFMWLENCQKAGKRKSHIDITSRA